MSLVSVCPTCRGLGKLLKRCRCRGEFHVCSPPYDADPCSDCVGGRVVSESVIEEMGLAMFRQVKTDPRLRKLLPEWDGLAPEVRESWRDKARAAGRVVLEHMEDNE